MCQGTVQPLWTAWLHNLSDCQEFWLMSPIRQHREIHPGSLCNTNLGHQMLCCPIRHTCTNHIPEGLKCPGCKEKAEKWGFTTFNALFCTRTDPAYQKPPSPVDILQAVKQLLCEWIVETTAEMISVDRPPLDPAVYKFLECGCGLEQCSCQEQD